MKSPWQPPFMAITAGLFAWQVHGWIWGLVVAAALFFAVPMVTGPLFWRSATAGVDMDKLIKRMVMARWAIWALVMVAIALAGARFGTVP